MMTCLDYPAENLSQKEIEDIGRVYEIKFLCLPGELMTYNVSLPLPIQEKIRGSGSGREAFSD